MFKRSVVAALIVAGIACFGLSLSAQNQNNFRARLSPVPMDNSMRATVAGLGSATAVLAGSKLTINATFNGLISPATTARLYRGRARGVRGPAIFDLTISKAVSGTVTGAVDLSAEQLDALRKGSLYIQIDSERAPEGNLWGWLLP